MEFSLVCTGTSEEVEQVFVCGEDQAFFECDCELPRALVDLIAAYYVFDVKYPHAVFLRSSLLFTRGCITAS